MKLTPKIDYLHNNFQPLLKKYLKNWNPKHFSWFDRAAIVKMMVLPRLLYLFHALPIDIPSTFKRLIMAQKNFIWANKTTHPNRSTSPSQIKKRNGYA